MPPQLPGAAPAAPSSAPLSVGGAPLLLTGEDVLKLTVLNAAAGVTVKVSGRFLPIEGGHPVPFASTLVPATNRTASALVIPLAAGWLLNAQVLVSVGTPQVGQTYAILSVARGVTANAEDLFTIAAGTITTIQRVSYPGSGVASSLDGGGALRLINGTTPAAGVGVFETVPTGARWQLLYIKALLATSAAVANRQPFLSFDDGANFYAEFDQAVTIAASSSKTYLWAHGMPVASTTAGQGLTQGMGTTPWLPAGHRINVGALSLDAADQFSAVRYVVREWLEGN